MTILNCFNGGSEYIYEDREWMIFPECVNEQILENSRQEKGLMAYCS